MSTIDELLQEDIQEKKSSARDYKHKASGKGPAGKVRFATDLMSRSEKLRHTRGGKVMSWNMNEILPMMEFEAYPQQQQKEMLEAWRTKYTNRMIWEKLGTTQGKYYTLVEKLGVIKDPASVQRGANPKPSRKKDDKSVATKATRKAVRKEDVGQVIELVERKPTVESITSPTFTPGFNFNINGEYKSDVLSNWLTKLQMMIEGEGEFECVIHLREKNKA